MHINQRDSLSLLIAPMSWFSKMLKPLTWFLIWCFFKLTQKRRVWHSKHHSLHFHWYGWLFILFFLATTTTHTILHAVPCTKGSLLSFFSFLWLWIISLNFLRFTRDIRYRTQSTTLYNYVIDHLHRRINVTLAFNL